MFVGSKPEALMIDALSNFNFSAFTVWQAISVQLMEVAFIIITAAQNNFNFQKMSHPYPEKAGIIHM